MIPLLEDIENDDGSPTFPDTIGSSRQDAFSLRQWGLAKFAPRYSPIRYNVEKERNLDRKDNFCKGESVSDKGSKNREIHVSGYFLESEKDSFDAILDNEDPLDVISPVFDGEVRVDGGEFDGPQHLDPQTRERLFAYSLDLVSTGVDEYGSEADDGGIVSDGYDDVDGSVGIGIE